MSWLIQAMAGIASGSVESAVPELRTHASVGQGDRANDWLCAGCLHRVASEKDRFTWGGMSEFSFVNPAGARFRIITFARTIGCRQTGVPTLEHTWFPGHAWSYCVCAECGLHLGWYYSGSAEFVGLILDRIVRAVAAWN